MRKKPVNLGGRNKAALRWCLTIHLMMCLAGITAALGQSQNERKHELVVETGHTSRVGSIAISPNGKVLASTGGNIILWDASNGNFIKQLGGEEHAGFVVFSPDGRVLASCSENDGAGQGTLTLWDVDTGKKIRKWGGSFYGVNQIAFSPDGKLLATTYIDGTITIRETEKGEVKRFHAHETALSVAFSPDGKVLASSGQDKEAPIRLWEVGTWRLLKSLKGDLGNRLSTKRVWSVEFSPDGRTIATSSFDNTVKIWDWQSGQILQTIKGHSDLSRAIAFSPDGQLIATSGDGQIKLWDARTGKFKLALGEKQTKKYADTILSMKFASDGRTLISGSTDSYTANDAGFTFWDITIAKPQRTLLSKRIHSVTSSPNGIVLAVNLGRDSRLLDLANIQNFKSLKGHSDRITAVAISPDGETLASASEDKSVKLWSTSTGTEVATLQGHNDTVYAIAFSPNGKYLASGSADGTARLWDVNTKLQANIFRQGVEAWEDRITSVAFSPDGKILACGSWRNIVTWDLSSGRRLKTLGIEEAWIGELRFSPDGKVLMSRSTDGLSLYDFATGQKLNLREDNLPDWLLSSDSTRVFQINKQKLALRPEGAGIRLVSYADDKEIARVILLNDSDWAVVTPDGRFDASQGAQRLMHYVYGLEIIKLEQLKERYYEPGLLQKLLGFSKQTLRPVSAFGSVGLYPKVDEIKQPGQTDASTRRTIRLTNRGGGIGRVQVLINGSELIEDARDEELKQNPYVKDAVITIDLKGADERTIAGQRPKVEIIAWNYDAATKEGYTSSRGAEIVYTPLDPAPAAMPELYAIIGGVSDYDGDALDLRFASKDAEDFYKAMEVGGRNLFDVGKVHLKLLATGDHPKAVAPTKENFKQAFGEFAKQAKPTDVFLVYLASHGVTLGRGTDTYLYLTKDARATDTSALSDRDLREQVSVSSDELTKWHKAVLAQKQVLILDTCAAGAAAAKLVEKRELPSDAVRAIDRMQGRRGFHVLMGSAADAVSYEASQYGQGLLTYALQDGQIDVTKLFNYAADNVPRLASNIGGIQRPEIRVPDGGASFAVGFIKTERDKALIPLAHVRPLILRPVLQNQRLGYDNLKLTAMLRDALREACLITTRGGGAAAQVVFVDADEMPDALTPAGNYIIEGDTVKITLNLIRNDDPAATFEVPGVRDNLPDLISRLLAKLLETAVGRADKK